MTCSQEMAVFKYCWGPECQGCCWLLLRIILCLQKERESRANMIKLSWSKRQFNDHCCISSQHDLRADLCDIVNNYITSGHCSAVMLTCQVTLFPCASQGQNQLQGLCGFWVCTNADMTVCSPCILVKLFVWRQFQVLVSELKSLARLILQTSGHALSLLSWQTYLLQCS